MSIFTLTENGVGLSSLGRRVHAQCGALAIALCSLPAHAQTEPPPAPSWIDLLLPLVLVIVTGAVAWWLVKRRGSLTNSNGPVQLLQVLAVGPRERLLLVKVGDRQLLCGATPAQITLLATLPEAAK